PVYGPSSFIDSFGAPRADVSWHHGDDIFAPLGAPVLAVADGTLFSVGWNDIGGLRVWLRDTAGNEFYFAHLSALATRTADGLPVQAGDVIGFVGNTGDARGTPYHLHFEIHPVAMLYLGYHGAVDPTTYLQAWARLTDVPITGVVGWAPPLGGHVPKAGAILLQSSDISTASGLDPASLRRAVKPGTGLQSLGAGGSRDTPVRVPARPLARGSELGAVAARGLPLAAETAGPRAAGAQALQPFPRGRAGHRVAEHTRLHDADRDAVARRAALLALGPVGRVAAGVERPSQRVLDLLVVGDPAGDGRDAAVADELVVDLAGRGDRVADVLADLLVGHRPLDVGPHGFCPVGDAIACAGHCISFVRFLRDFCPTRPGGKLTPGETRSVSSIAPCRKDSSAPAGRRRGSRS